MRVEQSMKAAPWLALIIGFASAGFGQPVSEPSFEVASVRLNSAPVGDRPGRVIPEISGTSLILRNEPLLFLIEWAFDLPNIQIEGPSWLMEPRLDISAKASSISNETQMRLMLRKLLADRIGLKTHTESRNLPVYALTLAKGGPKFQESTTDGQFSMERSNSFVLSAHHARMRDLAQGISSEGGRVVVDETGLAGRYEIRMDLSPYIQRASEGGGQLDVNSLMFTGLQEILGLKLEPKKANIDVLVIDHVEKTPTEN
jgi:uncharacterized protein (TIGR03435 family)